MTEIITHQNLGNPANKRTQNKTDKNKQMAGKPGFEPRLPGPEPGVLPLNYFPTVTVLVSQKKQFFYTSFS